MNTLAGTIVNIPYHVCPHKTEGNEAPGVTDSWMAQMEGKRRQRAKNELVEPSPSRESEGESGLDVLVSEKSCFQEGMEGQVPCSLAMSK